MTVFCQFFSWRYKQSNIVVTVDCLWQIITGVIDTGGEFTAGVTMIMTNLGKDVTASVNNKEVITWGKAIDTWKNPKSKNLVGLPL